VRARLPSSTAIDVLDGAVADRQLALADPNALTGRRSRRRRIADHAVAVRTVLSARPGAIALFHSAPMRARAALTVGGRVVSRAACTVNGEE